MCVNDLRDAIDGLGLVKVCFVGFVFGFLLCFVRLYNE